MLRIITTVVAVAVFAAVCAPAASADLIIDFGPGEFSGSGAGNLVGTVTVTISDIVGGVNVEVAVSGLSGGSLKQVYLNIDPYPGDASGSFATFDVDVDQDNFKADGDGYFDLLWDFDGVGLTSGSAAFSFVAAGLDETDFDALSQPGPGSNSGPFLAAIHVGDVGGGNDSGWYAGTTNGNGDVIPEPGSIALLATAGAGFFLLRRRRKSA